MDDSHVTMDMLLRRCFKKCKQRDAEVYGPIIFSIQASEDHYCLPQVNDLPLKDYEAVEIAIIHGNDFLRPSDIGIEGFDNLWEEFNPPIAPYVPQLDVEVLRQKIKKIFDE